MDKYLRDGIHRFARHLTYGSLCALASTACGDAATSEALRSQANGVTDDLTPVGGAISAPIGAPGATTSTINTPASYGAGPILSPQIATLYWGTFSQTQINGMQTYLQNLAAYMSGGTAPAGREPVVFQYGTYGATVGTSATDTTLPSNNGQVGHTTRAALPGEIANLQSSGKLPAYGPQTVIMVFTNGITFDDDYGGSDLGGWCGEHFSAGPGQYYSVNPFPYTYSCGAFGYGAFNATSLWQSQTSHELQEAATDPTAFNSASGNKGWTPEIGDQCNWGKDPTNTVAMSFGAVQTMVDNLDNACSIWTKEQLPQVSVATWGSGRLDAFVVGAADRAAYHQAWGQNSWQPSETTYEDHGGVFQTAPVAISWGPNRVDVFGQSTDNAYYHQAWDGMNWQPSMTTWEYHGGAFVGPPTVASWGAGRLDVFGRGIDGALYHQAWNGQTSSWVPSITGWEYHAGQLTGRPAAVSWGAGRVDVFVEGPDGQYYHQAWNGQTWVPSITDWEAHGGTFIGPPSVVSWGANRLDVFGQGTDGAYYHQAWDGTNWQPSINTWERHGGTFNGPPTLTSWGPNRLDIIGEGSDGVAYHQAWDGMEWVPGITSWESHSGTCASAPAAASWGTGRYDFFVPSSGDNALYHQGWNGSWLPSETTYEFHGGFVQ